jgi:GT2 family glycosyltransferase
MVTDRAGSPQVLGVLPHCQEEPRLAVVKRRPEVRGKFIFVGEEKLYVRGVTYGTFRPDREGNEFPAPVMVEHDFEQMAANGVNAVRTYTPPPAWLLDKAERHGLWVMAGLPVERSAGFLDYRSCGRSIETMVREQVSRCAGHPALLCYAVGNEIPASIVRWQGKQRVERFLERLYQIAKATDPEGLVTYVNYPSTEYLRLPCMDLVCFNVYLETQERLESYLAQLHVCASERPLIMGELGLDSLRNGRQRQAQVLNWQVRTAFASGCAGAFVYSWTDQWYRGGAEVDDWEFGITDRQRRPKPALAAVRAAFEEVPFAANVRWPKVSVIVCSHNGSRTIADTFQALQRLDYPDYEVIVVDDGSSDNTAVIARELGFRVLSTSRRGLSSALPGRENGRDWVITKPNRGLSNARNVGLEAASGELVAYIDDDAYPDPQWLRYLVSTFRDRGASRLAGVGGPNIAPPGDGLIADCVAHAPGGPMHLLLTNREAEHIPGCNMAFERVSLKAIGGFDPQFHVAGDDVDVCWRLQQQGWTLGFSPAAVVWHHRRNSVRTYWKQQAGYGKAEAMLERKWPEKYNAVGHAIWAGRIYTNGMTYLGWKTRRIYHGLWGTAPFQSLYEPAPSLLEALPMMPEWYLLILGLGICSGLGALWQPLWLALPLLVLCFGFSLTQAVRSAAGAALNPRLASGPPGWKRRALITFLFLLQPLARLVGRVRHGLTLWRRHRMGWSWPRGWKADLWIRHGQAIEERLQSMERALRKRGCAPIRGSDFDRWDLQVNGGLFGGARLSVAVEPHGSGRELLRIECRPRCWLPGIALAGVLALAGCLAGLDGVWSVYLPLSGVAFWIVARLAQECGCATGAFLAVVRKIERIKSPKGK